MARRAPLAAALCLALLLGGLLSLAAPLPARAATVFTVTTTGDGGDDTPDGVCDSNPTRPVVDCTLREAIQEANFVPGPDIIAFDIFEAVGPDLKTIRPRSPLPAINETVVIDGYSQPGARPNTASVGTNAALKIELDGSQAGEGAVGLWVYGLGASDTVVSGLVINNFEAGIQVSDAFQVRVVGCFIGTDATGAQRRANRRGVEIAGGFAFIGGTFPGHRNLISGNAEDGVVLEAGADDSRVQGNLIGTDATGTGDLGNGDATVDNGDGTLGSGAGVHVLANSTEIGGSRAAAANVIAFNGDGVEVGDEFGTTTPRSNSIRRNAIFATSAGGYGIDLRGGFNLLGPTANDPGDGDVGPNDLQNKPELTKAVTVGATTRITGRLNSTPRRDFVVQFFANPPREDEGQTFLGELAVTTDAEGNAAFTFVPEGRRGRPLRVRPGMTVTATATDPRGNTSEFSVPKTVRSPAIRP